MEFYNKPVISPDGTKMLVQYEKRIYSALKISDLDGNIIEDVDILTFSYVWKNAYEILYVDDGKLQIHDLNTSNSTAITEPMGGGIKLSKGYNNKIVFSGYFGLYEIDDNLNLLLISSSYNSSRVLAAFFISDEDLMVERHYHKFELIQNCNLGYYRSLNIINKNTFEERSLEL